MKLWLSPINTCDVYKGNGSLFGLLEDGKIFFPNKRHSFFYLKGTIFDWSHCHISHDLVENLRSKFSFSPTSSRLLSPTSKAPIVIIFKLWHKGSHRLRGYVFPTTIWRRSRQWRTIFTFHRQMTRTHKFLGDYGTRFKHATPSFVIIERVRRSL